MGQIENAHNSEDQGETAGEQEEQQPILDAVEQLNEEFQSQPLVRTQRALPVSISQTSSPVGKSTARQPSRLFHAAAPRRILKRLVRHSDHLVLRPDDLALVDVLDRIVRLGEGPDSSWAVDPGLLQCGNELV